MTDKDIEDVRAMYLEKRLNPKNAKALWRAIPNVMPIDPATILRPVMPHELSKTDVDKDTVQKIVSLEALRDVPKFDWNQIFSLFD